MKLFSVFKEVNKSNARLAATSGAYRSRVPLKPVRRSGECCKLSKRGPGGSPDRKQIWCTRCEKATGGNHSEYSEVHVLQLSLIRSTVTASVRLPKRVPEPARPPLNPPMTMQ